jgi:hypothetical protein
MDPGRARAFDIGPLPEDSHARLIHLSSVFGRVLFDAGKGPRHGSRRVVARVDATGSREVGQRRAVCNGSGS